MIDFVSFWHTCLSIKRIFTLANKIGFVSPERRYEAPGCCTAAAKVIIIMGKDAGFSWFPNRSVAINSRENRVKPLSNIYKQRLTVSKHATNERIGLVVV